MTPSDRAIADALMQVALQRGRGKTFCPSEAAKTLAPDWRPLMPDIRRVAAKLDAVEATQAGLPVDPETAKGPIRMGLARD